VRELSEQAIRDIAYGSTVLGTGGGGDPYLGTLAAIEASRQHGPVQLVDAAELDDEAVVAFPFIVGSPVPFLEKLSFGPELMRVHQGLERFLGRRVDAVMSAEVGGANSTLPMALAARAGIPVVDGDLIGRAFPEIQLCSLTLYGVAASPLILGDEHGNVVALDTISNHWIERLARAISVSFGAICVGIAYAISGRQTKQLTLRGTIAYAERIGIAIRQAQEQKRDGLAAVLEACGGTILFRGKIVDVERRTRDGWALGEATLAGTDEDANRELVLRFQNENLVALQNGRVIASVPDLITVLDAESGLAITTERLRYGFRVVVLGMACHPVWRTAEGLQLAGPGHWGYQHEFTPLPGEFPPAREFDFAPVGQLGEAS
jgi:DUF917 family protein